MKLHAVAWHLGTSFPRGSAIVVLAIVTNIAEKKLSKLNIFNPTPPLAKMIKCVRSYAMKYESDYEITDKVLNKSSLITTQNKISTFMQKTNSP